MLTRPRSAGALLVGRLEDDAEPRRSFTCRNTKEISTALRAGEHVE